MNHNWVPYYFCMVHYKVKNDLPHDCHKRMLKKLFLEVFATFVSCSIRNSLLFVDFNCNILNNYLGNCQKWVIGISNILSSPLLVGLLKDVNEWNKKEWHIEAIGSSPGLPWFVVLYHSGYYIAYDSHIGVVRKLLFRNHWIGSSLGHPLFVILYHNIVNNYLPVACYKTILAN